MLSINRLIWSAALVIIALCPTLVIAEELQQDNVVVQYSGIDKQYAQAIAQTVATARNVAVDQFAMDMPKTIQVKITVDPNAQVRLFNDGADMIDLTIRSQENLLKPGSSGIFHIYGLCHEIGHLSMYRPIRDHSWLTSPGAEGWAHYMGSRLVDAVYAKHGQELWPDRYDYREDGMKRLDKQLASEKPGAMTKAAGAWKQLVGIVGDKKIAAIFQQWGKAKIDPADPAEEIGKILLANSGDQAEPWWTDAQEILILKRPKSNVTTDTVEEKKLKGKPVELARDDGKSAGNSSIAGSGHAVRFESTGDASYVTEVRLYGSRYGYPAPPKENFHVWLCDKDFKVIADSQFAYSKMPYGNPKWIALKIKPTRVPKEFIVCVGFNPTATKGVRMHYDAEGSGNSLTGLPGEEPEKFEKGDWLIRVSVSDKGN
jgi:hypothetical protein